MEAEISKSEGPVTIKLLEPIQFGSETIAVITLQPVKGKHLKKLPAKPEIKDIMLLASALSGVSSAVFDDMSGKDILRIAEAVGELF